MKPLPQPEPTPPECGPTVERLQAALDAGDFRCLATDPHASACASCRGRIRAARALLAALAKPEPFTLPPNFADRVLAAVEPATPARNWRAVVVSVVGIAAAVLVAVWAGGRNTPPDDLGPVIELVELAPPTAPAPKPLRITDNLARAGQAIRDSAPATPKLFAALPNPFAKVENPRPIDLEPARKSLADLPEAAMIGFEPVTGSASRAFSRFVRDVSAVQPIKPKS